MRVRFALAGLLCLHGAVAWAAGPAGKTVTFISPMGEPVRADAGGPAPDLAWFRRADADGDGRLTPAELVADARRFFATLDVNHDGEIDPDELYRYENDVAPEIASLASYRGADELPPAAEGVEDGARKAVVSQNVQERDRARREQGVVSYFDQSEPVASADADLNRGVSLREFAAAALKRFRLLDTASAGYLSYDRLHALLH